MRRLPRLIAVVACALGAATPLALGGSHAATFGVSSSLDGKQVLPIRSHWLGYTDLPTSQVDRVEFVIDGTVRWVERHAPYTYASDDNGKNLGWLVTTWLSSGRHRFVVRVFDETGQSAEDAVTARVVAAPTPPPVLAEGTWQRVDNPTAILWFDRAGLTHAGADGTGVVYEHEIRAHTMNIYGVVVAGVQEIGHGRCTGNGCKRVKRLGRAYDIFGSDCSYAGPFGRYRWSVTGDLLTLKIIREGCRGRGGFLAHAWRRVR
jgi:hypothetical protein